jgi:hypothetical protein
MNRQDEECIPASGSPQVGGYRESSSRIDCTIADTSIGTNWISVEGGVGVGVT